MRSALHSHSDQSSPHAHGADFLFKQCARELTEHLGSPRRMRVVVTDMKQSDVFFGLPEEFTAEVVNMQGYEKRKLGALRVPPSGMVGMGVTGEAYRYGLNGMEKVEAMRKPRASRGQNLNEGNGYDFGARLYDGRLGRWWSVDPMEGRYKEVSPYHMSLLNPIYFVDGDGKKVFDSKGREIQFAKNGDGSSVTSKKVAKETMEYISYLQSTSKGREIFNELIESNSKNTLICSDRIGLHYQPNQKRYTVLGGITIHSGHWEDKNGTQVWEPNTITNPDGAVEYISSTCILYKGSHDYFFDNANDGKIPDDAIVDAWGYNESRSLNQVGPVYRQGTYGTHLDVWSGKQARRALGAYPCRAICYRERGVDGLENGDPQFHALWLEVVEAWKGDRSLMFSSAAVHEGFHATPDNIKAGPEAERAAFLRVDYQVLKERSKR